MSITEVPKGKPSRRVAMPRWRAFVLGLLVISVVYGVMGYVAPWALSLLLPRYGWTESGPGPWNLLGLIPAVAGTAGLIWVFTVMFAQFRKLPQTVELEATSKVLVTHGPFAFSRNPMFLSGLIVWLGWALYYGNGVILMLAVVFWTATNLFKVPGEERALEARFGDAYRAYKTRVPRWVGLPRRRGTEDKAGHGS